MIRTEAGPAVAPIRILAIDPGTRCLGVAILVGDDLLRADVENIRDTRMNPTQVRDKVQTVLLRQWIDRYQPEVLALELPEFAQSKGSRSLRRLVRTIAKLATQEGLAVRSYLPTKVRRHICRAGRPTRLTVAREVAERFPWLAPEYRKEAERSWYEKPYWLTMFDAVAVGLVCQHDIERRRRAAPA